MKDMEQIQTEEKETITLGKVELKGHYSEDRSAFWVEGGIEFDHEVFLGREIEYVFVSGYSIQVKLRGYVSICIKTKRID